MIYLYLLPENRELRECSLSPPPSMLSSSDFWKYKDFLVSNLRKVNINHWRLRSFDDLGDSRLRFRRRCSFMRRRRVRGVDLDAGQQRVLVAPELLPRDLASPSPAAAGAAAAAAASPSSHLWLCRLLRGVAAVVAAARAGSAQWPGAAAGDVCWSRGRG